MSRSEQSPTCNIRRHKDSRPAVLEVREGVLSFSLRAIAVCKQNQSVINLSGVCHMTTSSSCTQALLALV